MKLHKGHSYVYNGLDMNCAECSKMRAKTPSDTKEAVKKKCNCWCHAPQYPEDIRDDGWDDVPCPACKERHKPLTTKTGSVELVEELRQALQQHQRKYGYIVEDGFQSVLNWLTQALTHLQEQTRRDVVSKTEVYALQEKWKAEGAVKELLNQANLLEEVDSLEKLEQHIGWMRTGRRLRLEEALDSQESEGE